MHVALVTLGMIAAAIWIGSLVCLALVANVARKVLDAPSQVAFFRAIGRRYTVVGSGSLLAAIGVGLTFAWPPSSWSVSTTAAAVLSGALVIVTAFGMAQARSMTILRRRAIRTPGGVAAEAVRRGRRLAGGLRGLMAVLTLVIVALVALALPR